MKNENQQFCDGTCNARPPSTGFVNLGRNEDAAQAEEASQKRTETVETERKENAKSMEETADELAKLLTETSEKDKGILRLLLHDSSSIP